MHNLRRYSMIILWSFAIALGLILYTVGLSHESLGYERRWIYPFLFSFIPAFCIQRGLNYISLRKQHQEKQWNLIRAWIEIFCNDCIHYCRFCSSNYSGPDFIINSSSRVRIWIQWGINRRKKASWCCCRVWDHDDDFRGGIFYQPSRNICRWIMKSLVGHSISAVSRFIPWNSRGGDLYVQRKALTKCVGNLVRIL